MNNYLILGGAGFIGYHLAKFLSKNPNNNIKIVDNFMRGKKDDDILQLQKKNNIKILNLDLTKPLNNNLGNKYDYIFNLAAIIGVKNVIRFPEMVLQNNFLLQKNAINIAKKQKKLKKFIFFSTSEVYAGSNHYFKTPIPSIENTPLTINELKKPRTTYMLSKIYGESMCYFSKIPFLILRPHNIYGERMGMDHVIPELLKRIVSLKKNKKLKVYTSSHLRSFCYISDAIKQIYFLTISKKKNEVFNIGNDKSEVSIKDTAKLCLKIVNKKSKIINVDNNSNSPKRRCPSMKKTFKVIARNKFVNLESGISYVYNWYKQKKLI